MTITRAAQDDLEGLDQEYAADAGTSPGPNGAAGHAQAGAQQQQQHTSASPQLIEFAASGPGGRGYPPGTSPSQPVRAAPAKA